MIWAKTQANGVKTHKKFWEIQILAHPCRADLDSIKQLVWNLGLISLGSVICAIAINGILIPQQFLSGGITGIALLIRYLIPALPVGGLYFLLNVPIYLIGWKYVGRRFFLYSIAGMIIFSGLVDVVRVNIPVQDRLLSVLLAGIITGAGSGIILKSLGSAGGIDILGVVLLKRFSIQLGTTVLAFNSVILVAAAVLFSLEGALYTLIFLYVTTHIINLVVTGLSQRKAVFIISSCWNEISQRIMNEINRGVTVIKGEGGFTGNQQQILYTVITFRELARLKQMIHRIDRDAFVVVTETLEVMGQRIGNQPHW